MITNDDSPKWEVFRVVPVELDVPPLATVAAAASSSSSDSTKSTVQTTLQLQAPRSLQGFVPEVGRHRVHPGQRSRSEKASSTAGRQEGVTGKWRC